MDINKLPQGRGGRRTGPSKADSSKEQNPKRFFHTKVAEYVCDQSGQPLWASIHNQRWLEINAWRPHEEILHWDDLAEKEGKHSLCVYSLLKIKAKHHIIQVKLQVCLSLGWWRHCYCWPTHLFTRRIQSKTGSSVEGLELAAHRRGSPKEGRSPVE